MTIELNTAKTDLVDKAIKKGAFFRSIFNDSPFGIGTLSLDGTILDISDKVSAFVGYDKAELIGKKFDFLDHKSDHELSLSFINELINGSLRWKEIDTQLIHKDGGKVWVRLVASVIRNEAGEPLSIWIIVRNISDVKKLKSELQLSESRLNQVIDSTGLRFLILELDGTLRYMSSDFPETPKYEATGTLIWDWIGTDFAHQLRSRMTKVIETGVSVRYEHEVVQSTGQRRQYSDVISPIYTEGSVTALTVSVLDITRIKNLEQDLEMSKNLVSLVTSETQVGIWELNFETDESEWDENMFNLFGRTSSIGSPNLNDFLHSLNAEDRIAFLDVHKKALNCDGIAEGRFRFQREDVNEKRWISFRSKTFKDEQGKVLRYLGIAWDATKENEREMSRLRASELEAQNKELKQVAYLASHDLKGPLGIIGSFSRMLQDKYKGQLDDKADKSLGFIVSSVDRMQNQIGGLLDYAMIGQSKTAETIDLNEIIDEVKKNLAHTHLEPKSQLIIESMPTIIGHRFDLTLLFQNLMSNALKFVRSDVQSKIELSWTDLDDHYSFELKDNGIGIDKKYFDRIFVLFQRLHVDEEFEGTGIGLAQCKRIVELHLGEIGVKSTTGLGTTFHFTLSKNSHA